MKKKLLYIILLFVVTIFIVIIIIFAQEKYGNIFLDNIEMNIKPNNDIVNESNILEILTDNNIFLDSTILIKNIKFNNIENILNNNPYIENANVFSEYKNSKMNLIINVNLISPLVRVIAKNNSQFYIDSNANIVEIFSNRNFSVPILIANEYDKSIFDSLYIDSLHKKKINPEEFDKDELIAFLKYINKSELWQNQIDQILIMKNNDSINSINVELYSRLGQHKVIFGSLENYKFKLNKLLSLYKEILIKEKNWHKFSEINVKYSDQINCK